MRRKNTALLLAAYGMFGLSANQEQKEIYKITNPYAELPELRYRGIESNRAYKSKLQLTNKQKKARAKAKRAKQSRKRNR